MGARQVGKTWLMDAFAKEVYPHDTVYVNLMKMKKLRKSLDESDLSPEDVIERIGIALDADITPGKTLLVIDEIQESSTALTSLASGVGGWTFKGRRRPECDGNGD